MSGGNYTPLFVALACIVIIGTLVPLIVQPFIATTYNGSGIYSSGIASFIASGTALNLGFFGNISINPFSIIGNNTQTALANYFEAWVYVPNVISTPVWILLGVALVYGVIKIFLP
jgi:hypothetical protein